MTLTSEQVNRIETIIKQWHEAGRKDFEKNYSNLAYDYPTYSKNYHVGGKYVRLDTGTNGAFMVEISTGIVYEIKAYGVPNKRKIVGEAWKPTFHGAQLEDAKFIRGSYDNRAHLWVTKDSFVTIGQGENVELARQDILDSIPNADEAPGSLDPASHPSV
jgi:hypothetical protein